MQIMSGSGNLAGAVAAGMRRVHAALLVVAAFTLVWPLALSAQSPAPPPPAAAPLPSEQVDQLLAPIALYPDNLLGQVLTASTYPLEIVRAARWSAANPS